jgi:hypothetical protein
VRHDTIHVSETVRQSPAAKNLKHWPYPYPGGGFAWAENLQIVAVAGGLRGRIDQRTLLVVPWTHVVVD